MLSRWLANTLICFHQFLCLQCWLVNCWCEIVTACWFSVVLPMKDWKRRIIENIWSERAHVALCGWLVHACKNSVTLCRLCQMHCEIIDKFLVIIHLSYVPYVTNSICHSTFIHARPTECLIVYLTLFYFSLYITGCRTKNDNSNRTATITVQ